MEPAIGDRIEPVEMVVLGSVWPGMPAFLRSGSLCDNLAGSCSGRARRHPREDSGEEHALQLLCGVERRRIALAPRWV